MTAQLEITPRTNIRELVADLPIAEEVLSELDGGSALLFPSGAGATTDWSCWRGIAAETAAGVVVEDTVEGRRCVFLAALYRAERDIAARLSALAAGKPPWPAIDADKAIPWVEQRTTLKLADSQKDAIRVALT